MNSAAVKGRISKFQVGWFLWQVLGIVLCCLALVVTFKAMWRLLVRMMKLWRMRRR